MRTPAFRAHRFVREGEDAPAYRGPQASGVCTLLHPPAPTPTPSPRPHPAPIPRAITLHASHQRPAPLLHPAPAPQLCAEQGQDFSVCVIEKGSEVGAHIISGNVLQPTALEELFPGWKGKRGAGEECEGLPLRVEAKRDRFYALAPGGGALRLPAPRQMKNKGNYIISLRWGAGARRASRA